MNKLILGSGLSGLSAGYYLNQKFPTSKVTLIESKKRTGGWIKSYQANDNVLFEQGPRTIRPFGEAGANTLKLIEELKLSDEIYPVLKTNTAASHRMVYANGQLHSLPNSFLGLFKKLSLLPKPLFMYLLQEWKTPRKVVTDESIYEFTNRRFGKDIADYLVSPLICGICAGNAKEISVNFLMKNLFQYEQTYGSVSNGMVTNLFSNKKTQPQNLESLLSLRATKEKWGIYSFKNGLETLPKRLEDTIVGNGAKILFNTNCQSISFNNNNNNNNKVTLQTDNGIFEGDHLISTILAENLANLIENQHKPLSDLLKTIKSVNVGVVNLCYNKNVIPKPGFGFLVAPKENLPILGVIYDSCVFVKENCSVLTVMMGGYWFEKYFGADPTEELLLETAVKQLNCTLGVTDKPTQYKVNILKNCIPQYTVGHEETIRKIFNYVEAHKLPLSLCGASYFGVGVNDVILSAKNAVEKL